MIRPTPVEFLEARIAPASLVPVISADGKSATFVDVDGDGFTVTTSKGTFTASNFVYEGDAETGQGYLRRIDVGLASFGKVFQGAKITVTVDQPVGDGYADVGHLIATGIDLKQAAVDGDLVRIDVGDGNFKTPAVGLLQAAQFGFHTAVEALAPNFISQVTGRIKVLDIGNWADASIQVLGGTTEKTGKFGSIGRATIGSVTGGGETGSGSLRTSGSIGLLVIQGSLQGGTGLESGLIMAEGKINSASVGGDVTGGAGEVTGMIVARSGFGTVAIGGSIVGGSGEYSGGFHTEGKIKSFTVGADLKAGTDVMSGSIVAGSVTAMSITGSVFGGPAISGIFVEDVITKLSLGGTDGTAGAAVIAVEGPDKGGTAIGKITVTGSLSGARVLAGFDKDLNLSNPNARIGKIAIEGDLIASDIVAGIEDVNGIFGDGDDQIAADDPKPGYLSSIASIIVGGIVEGTEGGTDQHGILAEKIGSMKVGGIPLPLGMNTADDLPLGTFGDYRLRDFVVIA
ncbi:MAG TPA: hypothetical protein VFG14_06720 [Chthoniobacteraceae bacterium]|nr:hypothetical protein [Chthoniobacteraceae bacterium]